MKKIIGLFVFFLLLGVGFYIYQASDPADLTFKLNRNYDENIPILIDDQPTLKMGKYLRIPVALTSTRPINISVENQTKKIRLGHFSKTNFVTIDVIFNDIKVRYYLQTLPGFFPTFTVKNNFSAPPKGFVLISLHGLKLTDPSFSFILDMDGNIIYYRGHPEIKKSMFHLKKVVLQNGKIRYITHIQDGWGLDTSYVIGYHLIMDESFYELDRVKILKTEKHNAVPADEHDILMLDDGHYIVIGQDIIETTLPSGKKSLVSHSIIQEQKNGQVLLDWDSKEHPELQAACYEKCPELHSYNADYIHINSLFIDPKDNNLIMSSASGYYIMKIDRKTGDIIWILGGKADQFKTPKEAEFIRQHHVQILPDGRLLMFDNHYSSLNLDEKNYHHFSLQNQQAQILILELDEKNRLVKSFKKIPLNFKAPYMGSVQKLNDENWFIGCGSSDECTARMTDKTGNVLWDMKADSPYKMFRAYYYNS